MDNYCTVFLRMLSKYSIDRLAQLQQECIDELTLKEADLNLIELIDLLFKCAIRGKKGAA